MITIKKISTLKPRVVIRKCGGQMYLASKGDISLDEEYLDGLLSLLLTSELISERDKEYFVKSFAAFKAGDTLAGEDIYYRVLSILGEEVADWDFFKEGSLDGEHRVVMPHRLLLDRIRSPYNIGAIFRSAESFGIEHIYLRECGDVDSPRCFRTSRGARDTVPYSIISSLDEVKGEMFALETGGVSLEDFEFPSEAVCVLGSEESGVSPDTLARCRNRVSIPMLGAKGSINVSVAAGILMYSWSRAFTSFV